MRSFDTSGHVSAQACINIYTSVQKYTIVTERSTQKPIKQGRSIETRREKVRTFERTPASEGAAPRI